MSANLINDPISNTPSHLEWAAASARMKELEPKLNHAHLLNAALTLGQQPYGGKSDSPWSDEQRTALLGKYYEVLMNL